jgi:hypothetical protein
MEDFLEIGPTMSSFKSKRQVVSKRPQPEYDFMRPMDSLQMTYPPVAWPSKTAQKFARFISELPSLSIGARPWQDMRMEIEMSRGSITFRASFTPSVPSQVSCLSAALRVCLSLLWDVLPPIPIFDANG